MSQSTKQHFEVWQSESGKELTLATAQSIAELRATDSLGGCAKLLYVIEACTWEEASAIHNLRMGFEPYKPRGAPAPCPKCAAIFYPEGSGECWKCGNRV